MGKKKLDIFKERKGEKPESHVSNWKLDCRLHTEMRALWKLKKSLRQRGGQRVLAVAKERCQPHPWPSDHRSSDRWMKRTGQDCCY